MKIWLLLLGSLYILNVSASDPPKTYTTKQVSGSAPEIDGIVDDTAWDLVPWEGGFVQRVPYEGKDPSQTTFFRVLYDQENIYVAIKANDTEPGKIKKQLSRRDGLDGDRVQVAFDSYHDLMTAFTFTVNAAGVKADQVISSDGDNADDTWDPIWYVKTALSDQGWTAEMRIPLSQLRYARKENQVWGLQVTRFLFREEETSMWQLIPRDAGGWVRYFGEMNGIVGIRPQKQIELYPYVVARELSYKKEEGNPFSKGNEFSPSAGVDGKIGLTSNLTLDFTVNPDFGQVEADPSEVNLTTFESYFEEKRPFFIEGRNILNFHITQGDSPISSDNLFYSRRIGRVPHHRPDTEDHEYLDMPESTTIIGAAKLTGKTRKGLSIGILESTASREKARLESVGDRSSVGVEPFTNYFLARIQKDYDGGNTTVGGMMTATNRSITEECLNYLPEAAYTGGVDLTQYWKNKSYFLGARLIGSRVTGDSTAIIRLQRAGSRYFQRPGATHLSLDSSTTDLSGHGGTLEFGKTGNGHINFIFWLSWRSPGLELNDLGYLRRADEIQQVFWAQYRIWEPFGIFRSLNVNVNQWKAWDFGGNTMYVGGNTNFNCQFKNYWYFGAGINHEFGLVSNYTLRGGPALSYPNTWNVWYSVTTDMRKKLYFEANGYHGYGEDNSSSFGGVYFSTVFKPVNAFSFYLTPIYDLSRDAMQYVTTLDYDGQKRYIVADILQKTLSLTFRINYNITPDLTIQYYGQPFISSGEYTEFKRITQADAGEYDQRFVEFSGDEISYDPDGNLYNIDESHDGIRDYSVDNPDFNFLQFRSNLVARWEFSPGSTVYLVWSQGRTCLPEHHSFAPGKDFDRLFHTFPEDVFLVKFTYCFQI